MPTEKIHSLLKIALGLLVFTAALVILECGIDSKALDIVIHY